MEMEYFIRKTLLLLDAGSRVLRYFINHIETELPGKSVCAFLKTRTGDIQSSKLLQSKKNRLLKTDVQDWDFSLLVFAINIMAKDVEFDESHKQFLRFIEDHRDMLQYSELLEVRKSAFQSFSSCFKKGLTAFSKDFDPDFIYDIWALISEIKKANIEQLEKNCLLRNEIVNIRLKEYLSTNDAERKSEIQQILKNHLKNSTEHVTVDLQLLPEEADKQEDVRKWLLHTSHGSDSEPYNVLMSRLTPFGVTVDKGTSSICVVLNCQLTRCFSLLILLDGTEFSKLLENISTEISKFSGKDMQLNLKTMHVCFPERRQEQKAYDGVGSIDPVRPEMNLKRQSLSERFWKLQRAKDMCRAEEDLMKKLDNDFSKILDDICEKKKHEITKIIVICEPHSGAHSFLNLVFGQDLLPPSLDNITRIKYGKEFKITTGPTKDTRLASFVNKALSGFAKDELNSGEFEKKEDVVVVWPFKSSILPDNVEWIVMPETATNNDVTSMLGDANGLLYIANAGSSDCLMEEKVKNLSTFDDKFPVFILNRWNHVQYNCNFDAAKPRARDYTYTKIIQRLKMFFPHMNETQVLRFCRNEVKDGADQKNTVLRLLENLIDNSRPDISADQEERWIHTKASLMKEKVEEMKNAGTFSLRDLRKEKDTIKQKSHQKQIEKIQTCITKTEELTQRIERHLQSSSVRREISNCSLYESDYCPYGYRFVNLTPGVNEVCLIMIENILKRDLGLEPLRMIEWETNTFESLFGHWLPFRSFGVNLGIENYMYSGDRVISICTQCEYHHEYPQMSAFSLNPSFVENATKKFTNFLSKYQFKEIRAKVDEFFNESVPLKLAELDSAEEKKQNTLKRYEEITDLLKEILNDY